MRAAVVLGALVLVGCARNEPARQVEANQSVMEEESEADTLVERGNAFARVGDLTRAAQYFSAALDRGADEEEVLPLLMRAYVDAGRYRVAIDEGEQRLRRSPNHPSLRYLVGTLYVAIGQTKPATEHFLRVIQNDPKHAAAHYSVAVLLRDTEGDWVRADYHFRQYLEIEPQGDHAAEARGSLLKSVQ